MSSLQERLAARREQLQQERTVVLPIPGYEDMLAARYRILARRELQAIGKKLEGETDQAEKEWLLDVDTLLLACVELLEVKGEDANGKPEYASTGHTWTAAGVRELFGIDLPDGTTARGALLAVFPPTETELMLHSNAYDSHLVVSSREVEDKIVGESQPSTEGSSS